MYCCGCRARLSLFGVTAQHCTSVGRQTKQHRVVCGVPSSLSAGFEVHLVCIWTASATHTGAHPLQLACMFCAR